jgi:phage terminase large subunit-like protein
MIPVRSIVATAQKRFVERFLYYRPHAKQLAFHKAGKEAKERLFLAGNRTGKTYCGVMEVAMHLTGHYPDWWEGYRYENPIEAWGVGVTNAETFQVLEKAYIGDVGVEGAIAQHLIVGTEKIKHLYRIQHRSGGVSQLRFKSYEQGRKTFQGAKIHVLHMDEEPPRDIYIEGLMRTMATDDEHYGMVLLTMTPLMGLTDMVQQFYQEKEEGKVQDKKFYIQASWEDNPHLKSDEKATILNSLRPHEKEAREKGIPSIGRGLVYPVPESIIVCKPCPLPDYWPKVYGMDFGWNPSPTAVLFAAHDRDNDIVYIYAEYTDTEKTPAEHVYQLNQRGYDLSKMAGVYDPAGKISAQKDGENLITLYRKSGVMNLSKADNSKEKGLMTVLERMQKGGLKIFSTCHKTLKEFRMYARDENGIAKKENDHLMDCMRYIIMSGLSRGKAGRPRENRWKKVFVDEGEIGSHRWMGN